MLWILICMRERAKGSERNCADSGEQILPSLRREDGRRRNLMYLTIPQLIGIVALTAISAGTLVLFVMAAIRISGEEDTDER